VHTDELRGCTALVTGGGRGLGRAFATALAKAGAAVAIAARSRDQLVQTETLIRDHGGAAVSVAADVSDPDSVRAMMMQVENALGPVDLLVNNAGTGGPFGPTWEADAEEWWSCLEINLRSAVLCCHAVLPSMIARGRGRIINVASGAGAAPIAYMSAYVTSKAALIHFTETLAAETRPHGIAVFSIHPGTVRTSLSEDLMGSAKGRRWLPWFQSIFERGQDVSPDAASRLVLFLASGAADRLSGRFFTVQEDPAEVVRRAGEVESDDLYVLRLRRLT